MFLWQTKYFFKKVDDFSDDGYNIDSNSDDITLVSNINEQVKPDIQLGEEKTLSFANEKKGETSQSSIPQKGSEVKQPKFQSPLQKKNSSSSSSSGSKNAPINNKAKAKPPKSLAEPYGLIESVDDSIEKIPTKSGKEIKIKRRNSRFHYHKLLLIMDHRLSKKTDLIQIKKEKFKHPHNISHYRTK